MRRKKLIVILISVITVFTLGAITTLSDFKYKKTLKFRDHEVHYDYYLKGRKKLYEGHYLENKDLEHQAYMILANRLLDDYLKNPAPGLKDEILRIRNEHHLYFEPKVTSIDSLVKNRKTLMDTLIFIF